MSTPKITKSDLRTGAPSFPADGFVESLNKIYKLYKGKGGDKAAAKKIGTSQQNFNRWRKGEARPNDLAIAQIARRLNLSETNLLGGHINEDPEHYGINPLNKDAMQLIERFRRLLETGDQKLLHHFHMQLDYVERALGLSEGDEPKTVEQKK